MHTFDCIEKKYKFVDVFEYVYLRKRVTKFGNSSVFVQNRFKRFVIS